MDLPPAEHCRYLAALRAERSPQSHVQQQQNHVKNVSVTSLALWHNFQNQQTCQLHGTHILPSRLFPGVTTIRPPGCTWDHTSWLGSGGSSSLSLICSTHLWVIPKRHPMFILPVAGVLTIPRCAHTPGATSYRGCSHPAATAQGSPGEDRVIHLYTAN